MYASQCHLSTPRNVMAAVHNAEGTNAKRHKTLWHYTFQTRNISIPTQSFSLTAYIDKGGPATLHAPPVFHCAEHAYEKEKRGCSLCNAAY